MMLKGTRKKIVKNKEMSSMEKFLQGPHCIDFMENVSLQYDEITKIKPNITVGFGCVSYSNGLSQGVPIDIYTMLLTAERLRREVLPESKVKVLIGDHFAHACVHESCTKETDAVEKIVNKYIKKIMHILINLGISDHYEIVKSSDIVKTDKFLQIKDDLEMKLRNEIFFHSMDQDTQNIINKVGYEEGHRWYFMEQTAIFKYLYDNYHCGTKISWARVTGNGQRDKRKIRQSNCFDEGHFDRFYRNLFNDEEEQLSFIYTKPGFAGNVKNEKCKQIPYTAPMIEGIERVFLSKKQSVTKSSDPANPNLVKVVADSAEYVKTILPNLQDDLRQDSEYNDSYTPFYKNVALLKKLSQKSKAANEDKDVSIEDVVKALKLQD